MPAEYEQVLKSVGQFMEYWGFKAVHGKIWACIFLAKSPVDASFLIEQLKVSKAAISLGLKDLLYYKVILEVEKEGPSTQKYVSNPDLVDVICNVLRFREKKMLQTIVHNSRSLQQVSDSTKNNCGLDAEKIVRLQQMSNQAHATLEQMLNFQMVNFKEISQLLSLGIS